MNLRYYLVKDTKSIPAFMNHKISSSSSSSSSSSTSSSSSSCSSSSSSSSSTSKSSNCSSSSHHHSSDCEADSGYYIIFLVLIIFTLLFLCYKCYKHCRGHKKQHPKKREGYSDEVFRNVDTGNENDSWDQLRVGKRSLDCYKLGNDECLNYSNCGLCIKDGQSSCVPGDEQGPLFKEDCQGWAHTNTYDRYIFGEKVLTVSPPWSMFYPDYEARYPSPTSRATLQ